MQVNEWKNFVIDASISVHIDAPPEADVVFLPISSDGHQGHLNQVTLDRLGLKIKLPRPHELRAGYHFQTEERCLLCFIVTATDIHPAATLNAHLNKALADPALSGMQSLWLPLLRTDEAGLEFAMCLRITVDALRSSRIVMSGALKVVIAIPSDIPQPQQDAMAVAIGELSNTTKPESIYVRVNEPAAVSPPIIARAVTELMTYAAALARVPIKPRERLSTTLIFFALVESQSDEAPAMLREDMDAEIFSAAVRLLANDQYASQKFAYFGSQKSASTYSQASGELEASTNVKAVLDGAYLLAGGMAQSIIQISHLVHALLASQKGGLLKVLEHMSIKPLDLLREFDDARLGKVATRPQQ